MNENKFQKLKEILKEDNIDLDSHGTEFCEKIWIKFKECTYDLSINPGEAQPLEVVIDKLPGLEEQEQKKIKLQICKSWEGVYNKVKMLDTKKQYHTEKLERTTSEPEQLIQPSPRLNQSDKEVSIKKIENKIAEENNKKRPPDRNIHYPKPSISSSPKISKISSDYRYALKNAMVGKQYEDEIDFHKIPVEGKVIDYHIEGLVEGLNLIKERNLLAGIPKVSGNPDENYEIMLILRYSTDQQSNGSREITLKILPDPRSLWKEIEPPESEDSKDWKVHTDHCKINLKDEIIEKKLIFASKRGRSHAHKGSYRDDDAVIGFLENSGWMLMVVADGAGSAKLSRLGSKIACKSVEQFLREKLKEFAVPIINEADVLKNKPQIESIMMNAAYTAANKIEEEAKQRGLPRNDFATTLLFTICKKFEFGYLIGGFWVGDGALAIYRNGKDIKLLGIPDSGEFGGQTRFLTMKEILIPDELRKRVKIEIVKDFTALFAMTDGISDPKFETDNNLQNIKYWDMLWDELVDENGVNLLKTEEPDKKLLEWLDFWSEGNHDDRTIAILY